jgi:hypothetical protein
MARPGRGRAGPDRGAARRDSPGKTGALIRACCELGGMAAGANPTQMVALTGFGQEVGLAFQVADDLLDATGSSAELGKTAGRDALLAKSTYVSLLGVEGARAEAERLVALAIARLQHSGLQAETLSDLAALLLPNIVTRADVGPAMPARRAWRAYIERMVNDLSGRHSYSCGSQETEQGSAPGPGAGSPRTPDPDRVRHRRPHRREPRLRRAAIALLREFDSPTDKVVWDVGHQAYAWKLLTGRNENFRRSARRAASPAFSSGPRARTTSSAPARRHRDVRGARHGDRARSDGASTTRSWPWSATARSPAALL